MNLTWAEIESIVSNANCNVVIYGGPSLGKSYTAQKLKGYAITIHDGTAADELRGHFVPADGGFKWHDGVAMRAWREGVPLVINEIDKGSDEVKSILHVIADNPETAKLTLPTGETTQPARGFKAIATMNGTPDDLPEALRTRFPVAIFVDEPHPDAVSKLPRKYQEIARNSVTAEGDRAIPLRSWYALADLEPVLGPDLALRAIFGGRSEEIGDAIKLNHFDRDPDPEPEPDESDDESDDESEESEDKGRFSVGDEVIIVKEKSCDGEAPAGSVGKISAISGDNEYRVVFDFKLDDGTDYNFYKGEDLDFS